MMRVKTMHASSLLLKIRIKI